MKTVTIFKCFYKFRLYQGFHTVCVLACACMCVCVSVFVVCVGGGVGVGLVLSCVSAFVFQKNAKWLAKYSSVR
jgi:hypothetical protein